MSRVDIEARISPGILELGTLDRMDILRGVVAHIDFDSEDERAGVLDIAGHRVCWVVEGFPAESLAIGLFTEFLEWKRTTSVGAQNSASW